MVWKSIKSDKLYISHISQASYFSLPVSSDSACAACFIVYYQFGCHGRDHMPHTGTGRSTGTGTGTNQLSPSSWETLQCLRSKIFIWDEITFFYYYQFLSLFLPKLISSKKLPSSKRQNKTHHQNKPPLLWWKWMRRGHAEISDFFFSLDLFITEASGRRAATSARSVLHHHPRKSVTPSWREKGTSGSTVPSSAHTSSLRGSQYFSSCSFPNSQSWDSALWGHLQALCGHPHWQVL